MLTEPRGDRGPSLPPISSAWACPAAASNAPGAPPLGTASRGRPATDTSPLGFKWFLHLGVFTKTKGASDPPPQLKQSVRNLTGQSAALAQLTLVTTHVTKTLASSPGPDPLWNTSQGCERAKETPQDKNFNSHTPGYNACSREEKRPCTERQVTPRSGGLANRGASERTGDQQV